MTDIWFFDPFSGLKPEYRATHMERITNKRKINLMFFKPFISLRETCI